MYNQPIAVELTDVWDGIAAIITPDGFILNNVPPGQDAHAAVEAWIGAHTGPDGRLLQDTALGR